MEDEVLSVIRNNPGCTIKDILNARPELPKTRAGIILRRMVHDGIITKNTCSRRFHHYYYVKEMSVMTDDPRTVAEALQQWQNKDGITVVVDTTTMNCIMKGLLTSEGENCYTVHSSSGSLEFFDIDVTDVDVAEQKLYIDLIRRERWLSPALEDHVSMLDRFSPNADGAPFVRIENEHIYLYLDDTQIIYPLINEVHCTANCTANFTVESEIPVVIKGSLKAPHCKNEKCSVCGGSIDWDGF